MFRIETRKMLGLLQMQQLWKASHKENIKENKAQTLDLNLEVEQAMYKQLWRRRRRVLEHLMMNIVQTRCTTEVWKRPTNKKSSHKIFLKGLEEQLWVEVTVIWWNILGSTTLKTGSSFLSQVLFLFLICHFFFWTLKPGMIQYFLVVNCTKS